MRVMIRRSVHVIVVAISFFTVSGRAQHPEQATRPVASATIAAKKPVFAGRVQSVPVGHPGESHSRRTQLLRLQDHHLLGLLVELRAARDGRQDQTGDACGGCRSSKVHTGRGCK